jgi:hypothetical protein
MYWSVSGFQKKNPDDDLRIETYVGVYIYKSYNKGGFNSASVGVKLFNYEMFCLRGRNWNVTFNLNQGQNSKG